jgi:DNA-binding beta-propeller fold protein YncE
MNTSRRTQLVVSRRAAGGALLAAILAACGAAGGPGRPQPTPAAIGPNTPDPALLPLHLLPGGGWGEPPPGYPRPPAPVELVWQADGGADRLSRPAGLAVDRRGVLTVVDAGNDRLVRLTASAGEVIARLGGHGVAAGRFRFASRPDDDERSVGRSGGGVAVDGEGALYVADPFNARVQRLDRDGQSVADWGKLPPSAGRLIEPVGIAVDDRRGYVYVADSAEHRVHAFDRDGRWRLAWGGLGHEPGRFIRPSAVAVDRHGHVYVADAGNRRVQVFDAGGRLMTAWNLSGLPVVEFNAPFGLAVDSAGRVYVAGVYGVEVYTASGVGLATWNAGAGGEVFVPNGIAVDEADAIYVSDLGRSRVLKFRPTRPWPTPTAARPTPPPPAVGPTESPTEEGDSPPAAELPVAQTAPAEPTDGVIGIADPGSPPTATPAPPTPVPTLIPMTPSDR